MGAKTDRLEMRLAPAHKALLERAAAAQGLPLSAFAVSTLLERAREVLDRQHMTNLSRRDMEAFVRLLEADERPAPALRAAARRLGDRRA
jgi:uncharacterized protein (DUF1778 family)